MLIDPPYPFDMSDIKGILGATVARVLTLEFAVRLLFLFGFFERLDLGLGEQRSLLRDLRFKGF